MALPTIRSGAALDHPSPWSSPHRIARPIPFEHFRHDPAAMEAALRAHVARQDIIDNAAREPVLPLWAIIFAALVLAPFVWRVVL